MQAIRPGAEGRAAKGQSAMWLTLALLIIPAFFGVAGQLMLKHGMAQMGTLEISGSAMPLIAWRMLTSPWVVGGLAIYLSGTFFWLLALNRVDLSFAFPFASLSYVFTFLGAWLLLGERISMPRGLGMLVIVIGILLVART